jgi:hypothetical protein
MSKCCGCYPEYNFSQLSHMGIGGCQECYDTTYKNESFKTSKYISEINKALNKYLKNIHELSISKTEKNKNNEHISEKIAEINECSICYEKIGEKNNCVTECGHKFCLKCLLLSMDRSNTCPMCRHVLKNDIIPLNDMNLFRWDEHFDDNEIDYIINTFINNDELLNSLVINNAQ